MLMEHRGYAFYNVQSAFFLIIVQEVVCKIVLTILTILRIGKVEPVLHYAPKLRQQNITQITTLVHVFKTVQLLRMELIEILF